MATNAVQELNIQGSVCISKKRLFPAELNWIGNRFLDHSGKVFEYEHRFIRAVYPKSEAFVMELFQKGVIKELEDKGLCCKFTFVDDLAVAGHNMLIEQEASPYALPPAQWNRLTLQEAAVRYLDINTILLKYGLCLHDGHSNNFSLFENSRPKWFDLGSIVVMKSQEHGLKEFCANFLFPLLLASKGPRLGGLTRRMVKTGGISVEEAKELLGLDFALGGSRPEMLEFLKKTISDLKFTSPETQWSGYKEIKEIRSEAEQLLIANPITNRQQLVAQLIKKFAPKSAVDLGCNSGYFSILSSIYGAKKVLALDLDEPSNERFFQDLSNELTDCTISVGIESASKLNRERRNCSELVLAMALTHHLFITQKYKFPHIAKVLASYSSDKLITEFMPNGMGGAKGPSPFPLPPGYTLENFLNELQLYFEKVEAIVYEVPKTTSPRTLVVCQGRNDVSAV